MNEPGLSLGASGRWVLFSGTCFLLMGLGLGRPLLVCLGGAALTAAFIGLVEASRLRRALRDSSLVATFTFDSGRSRVVVGGSIRGEMTLRGTLPSSLSLEGLTLSWGGAVTAERIERLTPLSWRIDARPQALGYTWLQGVGLVGSVAAGLVCVRFWLPLGDVITVLPRRFALKQDSLAAFKTSSLRSQEGARFIKRRGFGMELRELREHQPGDSFKRIAWRASARRGRLMAREFEADSKASAWILLDVSPSMLWGEPGRTRVEYGMDLAYNLVDILMRTGQRAGLLLHDHRIRLVQEPGTGRAHSIRLTEALLEAPHLVHAERTAVTRQEVLNAAREWLIHSGDSGGRVTGELAGRSDSSMVAMAHLDERRLTAELRRAVDAFQGRSGRSRSLVDPLDYARDELEALARAVCRHAGVPLAYSPTPLPGGQAHGLERAFRRVLASPGGPHTLVLISDLHTVDDLETLRRIAHGARRRHHSLMVLRPSDTQFSLPVALEDGALSSALVEVERLRKAHAMSLVEAVLRPAGVSVLACSPADVAPRLLRRLREVA